MNEEKKSSARSQVQSYEERRRNERFAWLGPLLERRMTEVEPIEGDGEYEQELEELS